MVKWYVNKRLDDNKWFERRMDIVKFLKWDWVNDDGGWSDDKWLWYFEYGNLWGYND